MATRIAPAKAASPAEPTDNPLAALPAHYLFYGESGTGGSTGIATFPKPMLVFFFDPFGKDVPYLKRGAFSDVTLDERGTPVREVVSRKTGNLLIRMEYYLDADAQQAEAYQRFLSRLSRFGTDEYAQWATVTLDSVTFMELAARKMEQYVLNPRAKDPRQWYAGSKERLEEILMTRFGSLPMNVCVRAHVDIEKDELQGGIVRAPSAVGKLGRALPTGYSEVYRTFVRTTSGQNEFWWQTQSDAQWGAQTHVGAPNPCAQEYRAIWEVQP